MKIYSTLILFHVLLILIIPLSSANFFFNSSTIPISFNGLDPGPWAHFVAMAGCHAGQKVSGLAKLKNYLHYFGYLSSENNTSSDFSDEFDDALEAAIRTYQSNFRLDVTGELDGPTLSHMVRPRCGVPDIINGTNTMSTKATSFHTVEHYTFFRGMPRWPPNKQTLTYSFLPENELSDDIKAVFTRAFARWAAVIPLTFKQSEIYASADIRIAFFKGDHGDGEPFDGVLGTLAHSFSPPTGRFHLDMDETWVVSNDVENSPVETAVDLESVAVHEIGHLLGMGHSAEEAAIMYPTVSARRRKVELGPDDITGIQYLYGSNPNYNGTDVEYRDEKHSGSGRGGGGRWWLLAVRVLLTLQILRLLL